MAKVFQHRPPYFPKITSSQNYPYFYLYKNILSSKFSRTPKYLSSYKPTIPCTYLYAARKPFQFHGEQWLEMVKKSGGEVHKMDGGHWFMKKYAKFIVEVIVKKFVK
jgi:hypothetical protein